MKPQANVMWLNRSPPSRRRVEYRPCQAGGRIGIVEAEIEPSLRHKEQESLRFGAEVDERGLDQIEIVIVPPIRLDDLPAPHERLCKGRMAAIRWLAAMSSDTGSDSKPPP
jgi:hypothetical protein